jgi:hypothetical protein
MFALVGSVAAQDRDTDRATVVPTDDAVTEVMVAPATDMGYERLKITWTVPKSYTSDCVDDSDETPVAPAVACEAQGAQTPLTGFTVYYSTDPFDSVMETGVMPLASSGGSTALTTGKAEYTLKELDPDTEYYVNVAAKNHFATGTVSAADDSVKTLKSPVPAAVTGVMVEPGDKMLTVSWDEAHPDAGVSRTNLKITMYRLQYRESQTATSTAGDWMPMTPAAKPYMEVMGDKTTTMIEKLENDTSYDVQVRAVNDAKGVGAWSSQTPRSKGTPMAGAGTGDMEEEEEEEEEPMATPALPLLGILALGAGLVAAGRRRLS